MINDSETKKELSKIKKRLDDIEKVIFSKGKTDKAKTKKIGNDNYKGLSGGIRLLIDDGFFDDTKEVHDVISELSNKGYHYPKSSVSKILQVDFTTRKKQLNKIKNGRNYKYVIRK